jgi:pilus assembly protein CpaB
MARRTVLLVAAILVAALGADLVGVYVLTVTHTDGARQQPVEVLVAKKVSPAGTTGAAAAADGALEKKTIPRDAVASSDVLGDIQSVADLVTNSPIFPGEQILKAKFGKPGDTTRLTLSDDGTLAVSISLSDPNRVDGYVIPGSDVAVFLTTKSGTKLLLPRATVIAVGSRTLVPSSGQNASQSDASVVTFGVSQADAQKLIYAQSVGTLYLGLLSKDSTVDSKLPATSTANLYGS